MKEEGLAQMKSHLAKRNTGREYLPSTTISKALLELSAKL